MFLLLISLHHYQSSATQLILYIPKNVKVAWSKGWTVEWVIESIPPKIIQSNLLSSRTFTSTAVMKSFVPKDGQPERFHGCPWTASPTPHFTFTHCIIRQGHITNLVMNVNSWNNSLSQIQIIVLSSRSVVILIILQMLTSHSKDSGLATEM